MAKVDIGSLLRAAASETEAARAKGGKWTGGTNRSAAQQSADRAAAAAAAKAYEPVTKSPNPGQQYATLYTGGPTYNVTNPAAPEEVSFTKEGEEIPAALGFLERMRNKYSNDDLEVDTDGPVMSAFMKRNMTVPDSWLDDKLDQATSFLNAYSKKAIDTILGVYFSQPETRLVRDIDWPNMKIFWRSLPLPAKAIISGVINAVEDSVPGVKMINAVLKARTGNPQGVFDYMPGVQADVIAWVLDQIGKKSPILRKADHFMGDVTAVLHSIGTIVTTGFFLVRTKAAWVPAVLALNAFISSAMAKRDWDATADALREIEKTLTTMAAREKEQQEEEGPVTPIPAPGVANVDESSVPVIGDRDVGPPNLSVPMPEVPVTTETPTVTPEIVQLTEKVSRLEKLVESLAGAAAGAGARRVLERKEAPIVVEIGGGGGGSSGRPSMLARTRKQSNMLNKRKKKKKVWVSSSFSGETNDYPTLV